MILRGETDCRTQAFQSLFARDLSRAAASLSSPPRTCSFAVHPVVTQQALSLSSCWLFALAAFRSLQLLGLRNSYSMAPRASARASSNSSMTFPAAHCRRRRSGEVDAHALKREWYRWIDCAVERGTFVNGRPVTPSMDDQLAVAMSATFWDQKLVSFDYMFEAEFLDDLLRSFVSHYGSPDSPVRPPPGESRYASWTRDNSRLEIEQLVIHARIDSSGALRIEKKSTTMGVRVRISVSNPELSGELQEQDNPRDLILSH